MLTGLFGTSLLLHSLFTNPAIPEQTCNNNLFVSSSFRATIGACLGGVITGIFPGIGSAQAAIIGKTLFKKITTRGFIMLNGGVNTINFFVSLFTLHILNKARNGAVLSIKELIPSLGFGHFLLLVAASLFAAGIAALATLFLARLTTGIINKIPYKRLSIAVTGLMIGLTLLFSGLPGLLVLITATAIGLLAHLLGVGKSQCMGCILVPVLLYFLF